MTTLLPLPPLISQASTRFYKHACLLILGLFAAHTACFIASVTLINAQNQYITEVDDAGNAVITLHHMAIDCRCGARGVVLRLTRVD
jgi:hypothetical protein